MDFAEDIKLMVETAYERLIEGNGILANFADADIEISDTEKDKFIDDLPREKVHKWHKKMEKIVANDLIQRTEDYNIDLNKGSLTWKNSDVEDMIMEYFRKKIVKTYKKQLFADTALGRYQKDRPMNSVEEYCFLLLDEMIGFDSGFANTWIDIGIKRKNEFLEN